MRCEVPATAGLSCAGQAQGSRAWYNALRIMVELAYIAGEPYERYEALAKRARAGFARFWNEEAGYCYDVLDGPEGNDPALRPNQLLAVSLRHSPLPEERRKPVVDACARHLLTSHGLRSPVPEYHRGLDPRHPDYRGRHGGDRRTRDAAYHYPFPTVGVLRRGRCGAGSSARSSVRTCAYIEIRRWRGRSCSRSSRSSTRTVWAA